jgi:hypothetical protein
MWQKCYCLNQSDLSLSVITAYISDLSLSESCFQSYFKISYRIILGVEVRSAEFFYCVYQFVLLLKTDLMKSYC